MPLDADYTLFAVLTLVIMILSIFFTILLLRSKQSPMKKRFEPEIKYTENAETIQETEAVETAKRQKRQRI